MQRQEKVLEEAKRELDKLKKEKKSLEKLYAELNEKEVKASISEVSDDEPDMAYGPSNIHDVILGPDNFPPEVNPPFLLTFYILYGFCFLQRLYEDIKLLCTEIERRNICKYLLTGRTPGRAKCAVKRCGYEDRLQEAVIHVVKLHLKWDLKTTTRDFEGEVIQRMKRKARREGKSGYSPIVYDPNAKSQHYETFALAHAYVKEIVGRKGKQREMTLKILSTIRK